MITVVIPTYKRADLLPKAIDSVLEQDGLVCGRDYEVLVVSDGDPDAFRVAAWYAPHVSYEELPTNRGQGAVLNRALQLANGEYLVVQHDDDIAKPNKLQALREALDANPNAGIACALSECINRDGTLNDRHNVRRLDRYRERALEGNHLRNQAYHSTIDGATTMYRVAMLKDLGGWDETLVHGEEVQIHTQAVVKGWDVAFVDDIVAQYRVHGQSDSGTPNKSLVETGRGTLKPEAYANGRRLRGSYRSEIVVNISSLKAREAGLKHAVETLLPQCDRMNLYLLGYDEIPEWMDLRRNSGLGLFLQTNPLEDRGSVEKFGWVDETDGYYITCDDDVLYPPDYVERLIQGIERYDRKAICGFHGAKLTRLPVANYYEDREVFHFKNAVDVDTDVDVIGNVCGGFHTSALTLSMADFLGDHYQDDILLSCAAQKQGVRRICLAREAGWIQPNPDADQHNSVFNTYRHGNEAIARTINEAFAEGATCV